MTDVISQDISKCNDLSVLAEVRDTIVDCRLCPRLVAWRESVAQDPPLRYRGQEYWARPLPSFGDPNARLLIVGLAPAAHGSNRTGRMFTGDRSGEWVFKALHRAGFANKPVSLHRDDDLQLIDAYIAATCHCAPPGNKPLPEEIANCRPWLLRQLSAMHGVRVMLGFGKIGFEAVFGASRELGLTDLKKRPVFGHGVEYALNERLTLLGSYHPSQQNTFTGKLTEPMFDAVFERAASILDSR